jgi:hypothetical protein
MALRMPSSIPTAGLLPDQLARERHVDVAQPDVALPRGLVERVGSVPVNRAAGGRGDRPQAELPN